VVNQLTDYVLRDNSFLLQLTLMRENVPLIHIIVKVAGDGLGNDAILRRAATAHSGKKNICESVGRII
jgi:hypothetical protein